MPKLVRITTVPVSLQLLLKGQMRFMKENGFDVTMISSEGTEVSSLVEQEQCRHRVVNMTRKITPVKDLIALIRLTMLLRKIRPDIVHTHTPKAGLLGMWAAWFAGVPVRLHTIAGLPWVETKGWKRKLLKTVEQLTAMPANAIFPNSFVQREFMEREGIASGKLKVLGAGSSNGINSTHYSRTPEMMMQATNLKKQSGANENTFIWIFVGRMVKDKGIGELLDAFTNILQQYPEDQLWLLGNEEPELDPLNEQQLHILHHHPQVKWWGFQKDIRPYLAASKVLVFPSYREGFPNVPLQAACMDLALILSDINGCNEIVQSGKDGILVPVKDASALFQAMLQLRSDEKLLEQFSKTINEKIKTGYDQTNLWNIILREYQNRINVIPKK